MASGYPQCQPPIKGRPPIYLDLPEQSCGERSPGSGWRPGADDTADACGRPFACSTRARTILQPTGYALPGWPAGCVAMGYVTITIGANCSGVTGNAVVDANGSPIPGAVRVPGTRFDSLPSRPYAP